MTAYYNTLLCYDKRVKRRVAVGFFLFILAAAGGAFGGSRKFEFRASYGGWTFSPVLAAVERASERLASQEYDIVVGSLLIGQVLPEFNPKIDMSSSGRFLSFGGWFNLTDRWSVGLEGDFLKCRLPFSLDANQIIAILGYPVASVHVRGSGDVRLNAFVVSLSGRWAPIRTKTFAVYLKGGVMAFPYSGVFSVDLTVLAETPLGDLSISGPIVQTINEMRDLGVDAPRLIISPLAGLIVQAEIFRGAGLFLDATVSQGTFLSGGFFVSF
jgi:hypothetical protein